MYRGVLMRQRLIFFVMIIVSPALWASEISWEKISQKEQSIVAWIEKVGEADLVELSKMSQQPEELEWARAFFAHYLPDEFFNRNIEMSCLPAFKQFEESKLAAEYELWKQCIQELYRNEPPRLVKAALEGLKPNEN
jgi:hypothetical protein